LFKRFVASAAWVVLLGACAGRTPLDEEVAPMAGSPAAGAGGAGGSATGGAGGSAPGGTGGVTALTLLPPAAMITVGTELQLAAFVRTGPVWTPVTLTALTVDDPGILMLRAMSKVAGLKVGQTQVHAEYNGARAVSTVNVVGQTLGTITVSPSPVTLVVGKTQQLQAVAAYSSGQRLDVTQQGIWSSSAPMVASVATTPGDRGLVTAVSAGSAVITIDLAGARATAMVTVPVSRVIKALAIVPANPTGTSGGMPVILDLVATYSDGTTNTVTNDATFTSDSRNVAQVNGNRVQCTGAGMVTIRASYMSQTATTLVVCGETALLAVRMLPESTAAPVPVGTALRFSLTAYFSDGSQRDVSGQSDWMSDNPKVATVQNTGGARGLVNAVGPGLATISATYRGMTARSQLPVR
jgi:hypothetical protein